jgi:CxxC motif-containing protein
MEDIALRIYDLKDSESKEEGITGSNVKSRDLICIGCPMGCMLNVAFEKGMISSISGNLCKIGAAYAAKEVTSPARTVTSTVKVYDGQSVLVPVKTNMEIPKDKIMECMAAIKSCRVTAPIHIGEVIINNVAGTDASIIATGNVEYQQV